MADYLFAIAAGSINESAFVSGNLLENRTKQTDQDAATPWPIPDRELSTPPRRGAYVDMLDMSQRAHGFWYFQWGFRYLTGYQFVQFCSDFSIVGGALPSSTQYSSLVTVRTTMFGQKTQPAAMWSGRYVTFQCTILAPIPGEHFKKSPLGVEDVIFRFVGGTDVTGT